jgi:hypothetical protein
MRQRLTAAGRALLLVLAVVLGACGGTTATPATSPAPLPTLPAPSVEATTASTSAPTFEPTAGATQEPTPAPTAPPTSVSATAAPTVELPTEVPKTPRPVASGATPGSGPISIGALLTARISVLSLGDDELDVEVAIADPDSGEKSTVASVKLRTLDSDDEAALAATYVLTFSRPGSSLKAVSCTLHVKDGDLFEFVATDANIGVTKNEAPAKNPAELSVLTSSLCKP